MNMLRTLAVAAVGLGLLACSDNSQTQSAQKAQQQPAVCDLLTVGDIEKVTGHAMEAGKLKYGSCLYASVAKNKVGLPAQQLLVRLVLHSNGLNDEVQSYLTMMKQGLGSDASAYAPKTVAAIGDHAVWESFSGVAQLVVFKANSPKATSTVFIQPDGFGTEQQSLEYAKALAARALKRL